MTTKTLSRERHADWCTLLYTEHNCNYLWQISSAYGSRVLICNLIVKGESPRSYYTADETSFTNTHIFMRRYCGHMSDRSVSLSSLQNINIVKFTFSAEITASIWSETINYKLSSAILYFGPSLFTMTCFWSWAPLHSPDTVTLCGGKRNSSKCLNITDCWSVLEDVLLLQMSRGKFVKALLWGNLQAVNWFQIWFETFWKLLPL